jgi:hypothetical protein
MVKSTNTERARRINAALSLIKKCDTVAQAVHAIELQYGISKRQAYRYVQEAQKIGRRIPIPESKVAFTIKLPLSLIQSLRQYSEQSDLSLGEIVSQALETFLHKGRQRGKRQKNIKTDPA